MKRMKTVVLGVAVTASGLAPLHDANAWIAAGGWHARRLLSWRCLFPPLLPRWMLRMRGGRRCGGRAGCRSHGGGSDRKCLATATVVVQQPAPVVVQQPAYYTQGNLPIGTQVAALPAGSTSMVVNGVNYYQSGPTWYKPYFGSSGVYYEVVPAP